MITVKQISKHFDDGTVAVQEVSFSVAEGETLVLLGTSGCGKTTTLRMINRLEKPSSGAVFVNNQPVAAQPAEQLRRSMGYVLQNNGLFPHYTVEENIGIVPRLLGWSKKSILDRTHALLEQLHLPAAEFAHKYPRQLSGGQQQRIGLARALAANPPILLMDEPFGALDPVTRLQVRQDFVQLNEVLRKTIVLVTHDVAEAFALGNRICLMHQGLVAQLGTPAELLLHPASDFVRQFFNGERTLLEWKAIRLKQLWPFFTAANAANSSIAPVLQGSSSCWEALEYFTRTTEQQLPLQCHHTTRVISSGELMEAFHRYKQSESSYHEQTTRFF